jgi:hypothetical protein
MSTSNQTTDDLTANFTAILEGASIEYKALTGQDLRMHPFAAALENTNSPDSVLGIFQEQAQAVNKFRKRHDKLMNSLTLIVRIIFALSATLGEGINLVSLSFLRYRGGFIIHSLSRFLPQRQYLLELVFFSR